MLHRFAIVVELLFACQILKVRCEQVDMEKQLQKEICEIALVGGKSEEDQSQYAMLADDEELELRELQETSNPLTRCAHCAANGLHGCSLCKGKVQLDVCVCVCVSAFKAMLKVTGYKIDICA